MRTCRAILLACLVPGTIFAQAHNYTQGDIEDGARQYRSNCIGCHGPEGNLVTGIDLGHGRFRRVSTDEEIVKAIMNGVTGTGMPPNALSLARAYAVVAYLRNMNSGTAVKSIAAAKGDAARGRGLFFGKAECSSCHRVFGEGSRGGPDLSEAGLTLRAIEVETSILDPEAEVATTNRIFHAVTKGGKEYRGQLLNQDSFSVQMLDAQGNPVSLEKQQLRDSGFVAKSPMPSYRGRLDAQELADLIAYVGTLKGAGN